MGLPQNWLGVLLFFQQALPSTNFGEVEMFTLRVFTCFHPPNNMHFFIHREFGGNVKLGHKTKQFRKATQNGNIIHETESTVCNTPKQRQLFNKHDKTTWKPSGLWLGNGLFFLAFYTVRHIKATIFRHRLIISDWKSISFVSTEQVSPVQRQSPRAPWF